MNNEQNNMNNGNFNIPNTPNPVPVAPTAPVDVFNQPVGAEIPTAVAPMPAAPAPVTPAAPSAPVAPAGSVAPMPATPVVPNPVPMPEESGASNATPLATADVDNMGAEVHPDLNVTPINVSGEEAAPVAQEPTVSETIAEKKKNKMNLIFIIIIIVIMAAFVFALPYIWEMF